VDKTVYLSLGSNVGDRVANIAHAIERLREFARVDAVSALFETEPVEVTDQPWFINCAVAMTTQLTPQQLIASLLEIERHMGRQRTQPKGPRSIDLDILLFDEDIVNTELLTIPHPAMHQRRFVLEPLAEIAPRVMHPILQQSIAALRHSLPPGPPVVRRFQADEEYRQRSK
jgi:2-amino-4-hydroxy-6-hydroxymethyldihydropteridine diphosphokinase